MVITKEDLIPFQKKYQLIIHKQIFHNHPFLETEVLNRIDYKFDYRCRSPEEKKKLIESLSMGILKRWSAEQKLYETSIYYNGNNYKINLYDKQAEVIAKAKINGQEPKLNYENVIRYELQVKTGLMQNYYKRYGLIRSLENYWDMRDFFFKEYFDTNRLKMFYSFNAILNVSSKP
jgi:hypothetical protein